MQWKILAAKRAFGILDSIVDSHSPKREKKLFVTWFYMISLYNLAAATLVCKRVVSSASPPCGVLIGKINHTSPESFR